MNRIILGEMGAPKIQRLHKAGLWWKGLLHTEPTDAYCEVVSMWSSAGFKAEASSACWGRALFLVDWTVLNAGSLQHRAEDLGEVDLQCLCWRHFPAGNQKVQEAFAGCCNQGE